MNKISRGEFLRISSRVFLAVSGFMGLGMLVRYLGYQSESEVPNEVDLGLATIFPTGSKTVLPDVPAVLIHDQDGFKALSLTCTHLGCTLEEDDNKFSCPCHGSQFDENGNVVHGPANRRLTNLKVEVNDEGHLILYRSS
ncbi:MAG: ubiquinol-cytochrome c reductase iron-sulfur subunit [Anaerolineales bacterium]